MMHAGPQTGHDREDNDGGVTVFHVRNSNYAGGIETTLFGWFKYADTARARPRLFLFRERRGLHLRSMEILQEQGIDCELLPWGHLRNLPGAVYRLVKAVRAVRRPVLHSHDTRSDLVALIVSRLTGAPFIISNHAWHPADFKRKVLEAIRARLMRHADRIISVSRDTHEETLAKGIAPEKCMAMYSGIDLEPYRNAVSRQAARERTGIAEDVFLIGNIARLWPEKEQASLIEAAAILHPRYPQMRFVIIGDGPLMGDLQERVQSLGLQDVVLLPGFEEDFVTALAAMDCFAFPSSAEGTPMVIYSAMMMAVPIVASPVSGVGELLEDGVSALLVPPADAASMAAAIERIYLQPELAASLGQAAKTAVEENYSAEKAVRGLEALYCELAGGGGV